MLFTHDTYDPSFQQTGIPETPTQWEYNKHWCGKLKAKQIVLPTKEARENFKVFLDDTFSKSEATKDHCLSEELFKNTSFCS